MDSNKQTSDESSYLENLLQELKKLRQENISLKSKNAELEKKELLYAEKFMRLKSNHNNPNDSNAKEIDNFNHKFEDTSNFQSQLLSITNNLNKFINEKNNFLNYKTEVEVYFTQFNELKMKYNEIKQKYDYLINNKYSQLCTIINDRFSILGKEFNENNLSNFSQKQTNKYQSSCFDENEIKSRVEINQTFKNEILFEIKNLIAKLNKNNSNIDEQQQFHLRKISINGTKENNESNKCLSETFGDLIKPFESFGINVNKIKDNKGKTMISKLPKQLIDYINIWYEVDFLNKKISTNYKDNDETYKQILVNNFIPVSFISLLPINTYYSLITDLLNSFDSTKPYLKQISNKSQMNESSIHNHINLMFSDTSTQNTIAFIAATSFSPESNMLISTMSNLLFCVVSLLTEKTIKFLTDISSSNEIYSNKSIVVIHNLSHFTSKNDVEYYITSYLIPYLKHCDNSTMKKCFMYSVQEAKNIQNNSTNCWYYSQRISTEKEIIHLIYISNSNNNSINQSEASSWYNTTSISFLNKLILEKGAIRNQNSFSLVNTFNKLSFPKEINVINYYETEYGYCVKNNTLHIVIDVCGLVDDLEIEVDVVKHIVSVTGSRVMRQRFICDKQNMISNRKTGMFKVSCELSENEMKLICFSKKKICLEEGVLYIMIQ